MADVEILALLDDARAAEPPQRAALYRAALDRELIRRADAFAAGGFAEHEIETGALAVTEAALPRPTVRRREVTPD